MEREKDEAAKAQLRAMRGRTVGARRDRVSQSLGVREACLALLPLAKDDAIRDAIMELGRKADSVALVNDGYIMRRFDDAAAQRLAEDLSV